MHFTHRDGVPGVVGLSNLFRKIERTEKYQINCLTRKVQTLSLYIFLLRMTEYSSVVSSYCTVHTA